MTVLRSTVVDVDLDAIAWNLAAIARDGRRVIAVVKADAYGHGSEAVSRALVEAGVEMLAVYTVEEGIVLRRAGIDAPILVLGSATGPAEAGAVVEHALAAVVWDIERARALSAAAAAARRMARLHFKVDTGLTRLGAPPEETAARYRVIRALPAVDLDGVMTHFANADAADDTFTAEQVRRFEAVVRELPERPRLVHASASAGIAAAAGGTCNAVRPGLALYGLHAAPHLATALDLRPALRWSSRVHRVSSVPAGTGVGYEHAYRTTRAARIATVPVGYGDGLPRTARDADVLLRGRRVRIARRVAMDMFMLDVTDVPDVAEGDEVVLIGEQGGARVTAEDLAGACGTINYEVVTNLRPRVPRRYLRGGRVVATRTLADGVVWA
jgi:alanine racemase